MSSLRKPRAAGKEAWPAEGPGRAVRFATFNAALYRPEPGDLVRELSAPGSRQPDVIAEIIQRVRPDVLLINEFDYDAEGLAAGYFQEYYLSLPHRDATPLAYPHRYIAPANTGLPSGFDLDHDGRADGPNDAFGFGLFPGQYGMAVYSMYPFDQGRIRTFQRFLWKDMPGALLPGDPDISGLASWYPAEALEVLRLSSKSHWDLPIRISRQAVHFLASHPTPPVFDGPENRNGRRNFDEIRFWADYIDPACSAYIYDDTGNRGGLPPGAMFVIAGDQNADPLDGDSFPGAIQQLLGHPLVNATVTPASLGGPEQVAHRASAGGSRGDPAFHTADFSEAGLGSLRVDYVLPSIHLRILNAGVFWPPSTDPQFPLVGTFPFPGSDHRLVWVDVIVPG